MPRNAVLIAVGHPDSESPTRPIEVGGTLNHRYTPTSHRHFRATNSTECTVAGKATDTDRTSDSFRAGTDTEARHHQVYGRFRHGL